MTSQVPWTVCWLCRLRQLAALCPQANHRCLHPRGGQACNVLSGAAAMDLTTSSGRTDTRHHVERTSSLAWTWMTCPGWFTLVLRIGMQLGGGKNKHLHQGMGNAATHRRHRELQPLNSKATPINLNARADKV